MVDIVERMASDHTVRANGISLSLHMPLRFVLLFVCVATHARGQAQEPLEEARRLEVQGEEAYLISDIDVAGHRWNAALAIRQTAFGDSSAEAAVGYAYQVRYHSFMAGAQLDHEAMAWQIAQRAKRLLVPSPHVSRQERIMVLREFSYAFKMSPLAAQLEYFERSKQARSYFQAALLEAERAKDTLWMAQVEHDIGNTFTDDALFYNYTWPLPQIKSRADSALFHYHRSAMLHTRSGLGTVEARMMHDYCEGLLYTGAYRGDSAEQAVAAIDRALRYMLQAAGGAADVSPLAYEPRIANEAQMVEMLYQRAHALAYPYKEENDTVRLRLALQSLEAAVPYWHSMLKNYHSCDFYKVIGSYHHFPFRYGSYLAAALYLQTGSPARLQQALYWSDLNRSGLDLRHQLVSGQVFADMDSAWADPTAMSLPPGTVCIAYHVGPYSLAFIMDEQGVRVVRLEGMATMENSPSERADDLHAAMRSGDVAAYKRISNELYRALLAPVLKDRYKEVILVTAPSMERIPFEALVRDTAQGQSWGDLDYELRHTRIRYARTITEALRPAGTLDLSQGRWTMARPSGRSELPFARALVERMAKEQGHNAPVFDLQVDELSSLIGEEGLLHIASHAEAPHRPDEVPYIVLNDGPFTLTMLDSVHCAAPLVVLSTCSSGEGKEVIGDGGLSLGRAFLRSGAQAVVQTLWPVDDQGTSEILESMYARLAEGAFVSAALHDAKLQFLKQHAASPLANPLYWSGIEVIGAELHTVDDSHRRWWGAGAAMAFLAIALIYRRSRRSRARTAS